jgi:hypothetical protein
MLREQRCAPPYRTSESCWRESRCPATDIDQAARQRSASGAWSAASGEQRGQFAQGRDNRRLVVGRGAASAVEPDAREPHPPRSQGVYVVSIPDVDGVARRIAQNRARLQEDLRVRLGASALFRDDYALDTCEEPRDFQLAALLCDLTVGDDPETVTGQRVKRTSGNSDQAAEAYRDLERASYVSQATAACS